MNNLNFKKGLLALAIISLFACNNESGSKESEMIPDEIKAIPDEHTSQTSLDYAGTYKGVTPCADCEGIEVSLSIDMDSTYTLETKYLGKGDGKTITTTGTYAWIDGGTIQLAGIAEGSGPNKYKVGENQVWQLDLAGNKIEGELADKYILKKL